jgi:hypothetical protein
MNQKEILLKLLKFYQNKNSETYVYDFMKAVIDLLSCGDIEKSILDEFCKENGISPLRDKKSAYGNSTRVGRNVTSWKDYNKSSC